MQNAVWQTIRPPSVRWPQERRPSAVPQRSGKGVGKPPATVPKVKSQPTVLQAARRSPPDVSPAAHAKVARLQAAVDTMGDDDGPEVRTLREALKNAKQETSSSTRGSPLGCLRSIRGSSEGPFVKSRRSLSEGAGRACKVQAGEERLEQLRAEASELSHAPNAKATGRSRRRVEPPANSDGTPESGGVSGGKQERHLGGCGRAVAVAT